MDEAKLFQRFSPSTQRVLRFVTDVLVFIIKFTIVVGLIMLPLVMPIYLLQAFSPATIASLQKIQKIGFLEVLFLFVTFGAYMWCAVELVLAEMSGWRRLAKRFRAPKGFSAGQTFKFQSGSVGVVGYDKIWVIQIAPAGLYLSCIWPFRVGHPALLIPWSEIKAARYQPFLWQELVYLTIGSPKLATVTLRGKKVVAAVKAWLPQSQ
jgi:hypothetical protein